MTGKETQRTKRHTAMTTQDTPQHLYPAFSKWMKEMIGPPLDSAMSDDLYDSFIDWLTSLSDEGKAGGVIVHLLHIRERLGMEVPDSLEAFYEVMEPRMENTGIVRRSKRGFTLGIKIAIEGCLFNSFGDVTSDREVMKVTLDHDWIPEVLAVFRVLGIDWLVAVKTFMASFGYDKMMADQTQLLEIEKQEAITAKMLERVRLGLMGRVLVYGKNDEGGWDELRDVPRDSAFYHTWSRRPDLYRFIEDPVIHWESVCKPRYLEVNHATRDTFKHGVVGNVTLRQLDVSVVVDGASFVKWWDKQWQVKEDL